MAAIHCNCTIEAALDKCTSRLKRQAGAQGMKSMAAIGGRLPSWLHMPAMPMQTRHSKSIYWGDMVADNDGEAVSSACVCVCACVCQTRSFSSCRGGARMQKRM